MWEELDADGRGWVGGGMVWELVLGIGGWWVGLGLEGWGGV